ncbi:MAG: serpin family protein [Tissierellia bacterium]|nr:serpin family protein [Tissierellia bacterium]
MKVLKYLLLAALLSLSAACSREQPAPPSGGGVASLDEPLEAVFFQDSRSMAITTFGDMVEDQLLTEAEYMGAGGNLIYSPHSFYAALHTFGMTSTNFEDNPLVSLAAAAPWALDHTESETEMYLNGDFLHRGPEAPEMIREMKFPKEAEEASRALQKRVLDEVLLEPEYRRETRGVILNVTRFLVPWELPFEEAFTYDDPFTGIEGLQEVAVMHETMEDHGGFEDDEAVVTYKKAAEEGDEIPSLVYIIVPKTLGLNDEKMRERMVSVARNLDRYVLPVGEMDLYDGVYLSLPRLELKSTMDLLKMSELRGYGLQGPIAFNEELVVEETSDEPTIIDSILQVSALSLDERQVDAKAVTEMMDTAAEPYEEDLKTLEVDATRPFFLVIASHPKNGEGDYAISFMAMVTEPPEQK